MAANRISHHVLAAMIVALASCQEDKLVSPSTFESMEFIRFEESDLQKGIDWNRELALVQSAEVLEKASAAAGVEARNLKSAIRIEADVIDRLIKISCEQDDEESAKKFAKAYANAYTDHRRELAAALMNEKLSALEAGFGNEALGLGRANGEDFRPGTDPGQNALDRDRMTYKKAKAALEEGSDDGVLFRKEKKKEE